MHSDLLEVVPRRVGVARESNGREIDRKETFCDERETPQYALACVLLVVHRETRNIQVQAPRGKAEWDGGNRDGPIKVEAQTRLVFPHTPQKEHCRLLISPRPTRTLENLDKKCAKKHLDAVSDSVVTHTDLHSFILMEGEEAIDELELAGLDNAPGVYDEVTQCRLIFTNENRLVFTQVEQGVSMSFRPWDDMRRDRPTPCTCRNLEQKATPESRESYSSASAAFRFLRSGHYPAV